MPLFSGRCYSTVKLGGKTAIITGCNTGIGKETALDFYERGAKVIMACRSLERGQEAMNDIEKRCEKISVSDKGILVVEKCDLSSLQSVRDFSKKILDTEPQVNILVNNAGVMMCPYTETVDGFEMQIGTNHLGHFSLTLLLLPRIRHSTPARIVTVSSIGSVSHLKYDDGVINVDDLHFKKNRYTPSSAYFQSKLANVLFSKELAKKLKENHIEGINTYSLHPGVINTDLSRHMDDIMFRGARSIMTFVASPFMKSPKLGAQTNIYCAVDEKCANETGLYYSDCQVTSPSKKALDEQLAAQLWDVSLKEVGLDHDPFSAQPH